MIRKELSSDEHRGLITDWFAEHPDHVEATEEVADEAALSPLDGVLTTPVPLHGDAVHGGG
jgi:hypothetical protein